ncbi:hypothetical protein Peur_026192 [Populus x canadensis]
MLESELAEAKVQGKAVRNSQTDKINMLKRELDTKKIKAEHLKNQYFHKLLVCASGVHFHDLNAEVLRCLTIPNVNANLLVRSHHSATKEVSVGIEGELRSFVGDWSQVHLCLPHVHEKEMDLSCSSGHRSKLPLLSVEAMMKVTRSKTSTLKTKRLGGF